MREGTPRRGQRAACRRLSARWAVLPSPSAPPPPSNNVQEAIDAVVGCRTASPAEHSSKWVAWCRGNGTMPQLAKQFLSLDCAAEICAIQKHGSPAPPGVVF